MSAPWCSNVLRMVTPHLWLCRGLVEQLDKAALERVASVTEQNGNAKVVKRPDCAMEDFAGVVADTADRKRATDAAALAWRAIA